MLSRLEGFQCRSSGSQPSALPQPAAGEPGSQPPAFSQPSVPPLPAAGEPALGSSSRSAVNQSASQQLSFHVRDLAEIVEAVSFYAAIM